MQHVILWRSSDLNTRAWEEAIGVLFASPTAWKGYGQKNKKCATRVDKPNMTSGRIYTNICSGSGFLVPGLVFLVPAVFFSSRVGVFGSRGVFGSQVGFWFPRGGVFGARLGFFSARGCFQFL